MSGGGIRTSQLPNTAADRAMPSPFTMSADRMMPSQFTVPSQFMTSPRVMSPFGMMGGPTMDWSQLAASRSTQAPTAFPGSETASQHASPPPFQANPQFPGLAGLQNAAAHGAPVDPAAATADYLARLQGMVRQPQATTPNVPSEVVAPRTAAANLGSLGGSFQIPTKYMALPAARGTATMSGGGLASLATGRFLRGPGDGVSDDIPGVIHRRDGSVQKAALADGEFVVPARAVAALGQGSSEAGARKLDEFVNRLMVEDRKTGRGKRSRADAMLSKLK